MQKSRVSTVVACAVLADLYSRNARRTIAAPTASLVQCHSRLLSYIARKRALLSRSNCCLIQKSRQDPIVEEAEWFTKRTHPRLLLRTNLRSNYIWNYNVVECRTSRTSVLSWLFTHLLGHLRFSYVMLKGKTTFIAFHFFSFQTFVGTDCVWLWGVYFFSKECEAISRGQKTWDIKEK